MTPRNFLGKIKVDKSIKPHPRSQRKAPMIKLYSWYFISFHDKNVYPCRVVGIVSKPGISKRMITIEIPMKSESSIGYIDIYGNRSHSWFSSHEVEENEIGDTPEAAVRNQV